MESLKTMLDLKETVAIIHTKEEKFRRFPELIEQVPQTLQKSSESRKSPAKTPLGVPVMTPYSESNQSIENIFPGPKK